MRTIAIENATAKSTAARAKETRQGKILAQKLSAAQSNEARKAANFRIAAARRSEVASTKAERAVATAAKARARVAIKAEKDHERALKVTSARAGEDRCGECRDRPEVGVCTGGTRRGACGNEYEVGRAWIGCGGNGECHGSSLWRNEREAEKWAASFAASTGSSRFESVELVSDLGLIVKGMGFTEKASLGMSSRMVELAADMASAKNVPLDVALDKIRAGLIGESEPLRTMGVLLSEARVKQEAYASGLAKTGTELTNTQKVQARMNIILADSAAMHGDLINTQGSVANQWRAIKNRVFDAATALGQKLLPAASEVLSVLGELVQKGADLVTWITESEERMKSLGAILAGVVVTGLGLAAAALWALVPAVTAATGGINLIIPLIAAGVGALVAGWILFGDTIKDFLRKVWGKFLEKIAVDLKILSKVVGIFSDDWADAMQETAEGLEETAAEMGKTEKATAKLAKEQESATKVTEKATEAQKSAAKAAKKSDEAVQGLIRTWTGATLQSKEFLKAFKKLSDEQKHNDRVMKQVLAKYESMRKVLGPFDEELEELWRATQRWTPALADLNEEQENTVASVAELTKGLPALNIEVQNLSTAQGVLDLELRAVNKSLGKVTKSRESYLRRLQGWIQGALIQGITGGKGIKGVMEGIGKGITQGIGNVISGGLAALTNLAMKGIAALGKKIWAASSVCLAGSRRNRRRLRRRRLLGRCRLRQRRRRQPSLSPRRWPLFASNCLASRHLPSRKTSMLCVKCGRMSGDERALGMDRYAAALEAAAAAGVVLSAGELRLLDAFVTRDAAMGEATARQDAEMSALAARQESRDGWYRHANRRHRVSSAAKGQRAAGYESISRKLSCRHCPPARTLRWRD